jgi:hypothetical protein
MAIGVELEKKLKKKFEPSSMISMRYKNFDMMIRTDADGNAIQLFIGKANAEGTIKGERYTRTLKHDSTGKILKDHWEKKGRAS